MKYKHLSDIPVEIREPYIREVAINKFQKKFSKQIKYINLLKGANT